MDTHLRPGLKVRSRILSLEEANQMLPLIKNIVLDIMSTWAEIIDKRTQLEMVEKGHTPVQPKVVGEDPVKGLKSDLNLLIDRINGYIRETEELGCFVEEFKRGVINFPSLYLGRKVFLCWSPPETEITFWHELDESYNERSLIKDRRDFLIGRPAVK